MSVTKSSEKKKLLQIDVAQAIGVTNSTYAYYERGERKPTPDMLWKLADFFDVTIDELMGRTEIDFFDDARIVSHIDISAEDKEILDNYHALSIAGQAKVRGYIEGLKSAPEMTKSNKSTNFTA